MHTPYSRSNVSTIVLGATSLLLSACAAGDAGAPTWTGTRDTIDGVEVVRNPAEPLLGDGAVAATIVWTEAGAEFDSDAGPLWEQPSHVRAADGVVYVLDALAARVYAHRATDGEPLATIGRKGPGPGELNQPSGLALLDGDVVVADGSGEVEVFDPSGAHLRSIQPNGIVMGLDALGTDRLLLDRFQGPDSPWRTVLALTGESWSLEAPEWLVEKPADVAECGSIATTGATLLRAHCSLLRFHLASDEGHVLREVTVDRAVVYSSEAELDAYERRVRRQMAEVGLPPAQADRMVASFRDQSRVKRLFGSIRHDAEADRYWILEQQTEDFGGGPATLHLFGPSGVYLARLAFERAWTDFDAADGHVYALEKDPDTDLATLVAFRIDLPIVD